jgi:hypothetical protein
VKKKKKYVKPALVKVGQSPNMAQCSAGNGVSVGGGCSAGSGSPS